MNTFSLRMSENEKQMAAKILNFVGVQGARAEFHQGRKCFTFFRGRHLVSVPSVLVDKNRWNEIQYLFRAFLEEGPAVQVTPAPSEWEGDWSAS